MKEEALKWLTLNKKKRNMGHRYKNGPYLEKYFPVRIMGHSQKISESQKTVSQLGKCVTVRKMGHSQKNVSQLEKCVTARKMCHGQKNVSQLEKCVTVRKMGH